MSRKSSKLVFWTNKNHHNPLEMSLYVHQPQKKSFIVRGFPKQNEQHQQDDLVDVVDHFFSSKKKSLAKAPSSEPEEKKFKRTKRVFIEEDSQYYSNLPSSQNLKGQKSTRFLQENLDTIGQRKKHTKKRKKLFKKHTKKRLPVPHGPPSCG